MANLSKEFKMGIHNRFDLEVVDIKTGKIKQKAQALNVICNTFYTAILNNTEARYILVGKGTGTPSTSDTALFSLIGAADSSSTYNPYDNFYDIDEYKGIWRRQIKRAIPNTMYVGQTITEIGLATSNSSGLVTHAMLQDMNGNPISIEHTSTDVIYIYATIYLHYENQNHDVHLYNNDGAYYYNYPFSPTYYKGLLPIFLLGGYSGGSNSSYGFVFQAGDYYEKAGFEAFPATSRVSANRTTNANEKSIKFTATQLPITGGNFNGLKTITLFPTSPNGIGNAKAQAAAIIEAGATAIPSAQITNESVGIGDGSNKKFKTKFSMPRNAKVYVNGTEVSSGVTVYKRPNIALTTSTLIFTDDVTREQLARLVSNKDLSFPLRILNTYLPASSIAEILTKDIGVYQIPYAPNGTIKGSNDGETWVDVTTFGDNTPLNQADRNYKYYKNTHGSNGYTLYSNAYDGYNIVFDEAPANGDVITIDYTSDKIPKDTDHVLDVSITFTFGEWTGE